MAETEQMETLLDGLEEKMSKSLQWDLQTLPYRPNPSVVCLVSKVFLNTTISIHVHVARGWLYDIRTLLIRTKTLHVPQNLNCFLQDSLEAYRHTV